MIAITRSVSARLDRCQLSFVDRSPLDLKLAQTQHANYCDALKRLGCRMIVLPPLDELPDAVFVEDTAVVLDELAIMTRPGAVVRRAESKSVAVALAAFRRLEWIDGEGTLDGGDVLRIDRTVYVGLSARSNADGIAQLAALVEPLGYTVRAVPTRGCLHLKSAVTQVAERTVLLQPEWVDAEPFSEYEIITVDSTEEHAANALRVGSTLVYPSCFPRTAARLTAADISLSLVDVSELQKAEGAVTCCSLLFA